MKTWEICFNRMTHATVYIQAETEEEAKENFDNLPEDELRKGEEITPGDDYEVICISEATS